MDTLLWIDVETTGLDPDSDALLEIGMLYTDGGLHPIDAPLDLVLRWDGTPDDFIKGMHGPNGLLAECRTLHGCRTGGVATWRVHGQRQRLGGEFGLCLGRCIAS